MSSFLSNIATSLGFNRVQEVHQSTKTKNAKEETLNKQNLDEQTNKLTNKQTNKLTKPNTNKQSFKDILNETQDKVSISNEGKQIMKDKKVNEEKDKEDEPVMEEKPLLCNHDPNDKSTTLVVLPKRIMSYPPEVFMCCDVCRMGFRFVKNEDGSFTSKT